MYWKAIMVATSPRCPTLRTRKRLKNECCAGEHYYDFPMHSGALKNLKIPAGWMIPKNVFSAFSGLIFGASLLASLSSAQTRLAAPPLRLVPEPTEVQLHEGAGFRVGSGTVILVDRQHQSEDRIAAETLTEEIAAQAGLNLSIVSANQAPRREAKAIVLARLEDRGLREVPESKG